MSRAQRAGAALLALLIVGAALVVALIISAARGQDRIAAEKSIALVRVALEIRERNAALTVKATRGGRRPSATSWTARARPGPTGISAPRATIRSA